MQFEQAESIIIVNPYKCKNWCNVHILSIDRNRILLYNDKYNRTITGFINNKEIVQNLYYLYELKEKSGGDFQCVKKQLL